MGVVIRSVFWGVIKLITVKMTDDAEALIIMPLITSPRAPLRHPLYNNDYEDSHFD